MTSAPSGTVTLLFTDSQGSTRLWADHPDGMPAALAHGAYTEESFQALLDCFEDPSFRCIDAL